MTCNRPRVERNPSSDVMKIFRIATISVLASLPAPPGLYAQARVLAIPQVSAASQAPSDEEIRARTKTLLANQHADDEALELYDRVERHTLRTGGANPRT